MNGWLNNRRRKHDYKVIPKEDDIAYPVADFDPNDLVRDGYLPKVVLKFDLLCAPDEEDEDEGNETFDVTIELCRGRWKLLEVEMQNANRWVEEGWHCKYRVQVYARDELGAYVRVKKAIEQSGEQIWTG